MRVGGAVLLILAGILAGISLALPIYDAPAQPDRFDSAAYQELLDGDIVVREIPWSFGVPLGYLIVIAGVASLILGTLAASRHGNRAVGVVSLASWLVLGYLTATSLSDVADVDPDILGPAAAVWAFGIAAVVGVVGAVLVTAQPARSSEEIW